jgi:hypothetical protein
MVVGTTLETILKMTLEMTMVVATEIIVMMIAICLHLEG